MRRPASRKCQPTSRTRPSAAIPAMASSPSSTLSSAGRSPAVTAFARRRRRGRARRCRAAGRGTCCARRAGPARCGPAGRTCRWRAGRARRRPTAASDGWSAATVPVVRRVQHQVAERGVVADRGERGDEHLERPPARRRPAAGGSRPSGRSRRAARGPRPRPARRSGPSSRGSRRCAARCRSPGGAASGDLARGGLVGRHPRLDGRVGLRGEHPDVLRGGAEGRRDDVPRGRRSRARRPGPCTPSCATA